MLNSFVEHVRKNVTPYSVIFFILLCVVQAGKPFHLDNMDFPAVGKAAAKTGLPVYYRGEDNPRHSGLYHPPLYIYTLAAWYNLFGFSPTTTRMLGAMFAVIQGVVALMIFRHLFGVEVKKQVEPFFWPLYLLNPYTLAMSSIADIDSTIYGPLLLSVIYSVVRCRWRDGVEASGHIAAGRVLLTGVLFALALWAKLTTVLLLIPFMYLLLATPRRWLSAAKTTAVMVSAGALIFISTYSVYGWLLNLNTKYTFEFLLFSLTNRGASGATGVWGRLSGRVDNLMFNVPFTLRWTGLLTWVLILSCIGAFGYVAYKRKSLKLFHFLLLALLPLANIFYYWCQVMPFGYAPQKYHFVFWSLLHLPVAVLAARMRPEEITLRDGVYAVGGKAESAVLFSAYVLAMAYGAMVFKDRMIVRQSLSLILSPVVFIPLLTCLIAGALYLTVVRAGFNLRARQALVALLILCNAGLLTGIAWAQAKRPYTTTYNYGQRGMTEAVAYLRSHTAPNEVISSMKDIGFMSERRYFENYGALFGGAAGDALIKNIEAGKVRYAVFTRGIGEDQLDAAPALKVEIERTCQLVAQFGNYLIYEPNYWSSKRAGSG